jgi:pimeloyl-ACP methyl ester carboxylesterase
MDEITGEDLAASRNAGHPGRYGRIVIAAHSLGAPVVRRALLTAHKANRRWAQVSRAVLFAPAHRGASIQKLARMASEGGLRSLLYSLSLYRVPVLQDLHPTDSVFLTELREEHARRMPDPPAPPLLAHKVIFGDNDSIVEIFDFHEDEPFTHWPGHDHGSVCKAHEQFRDPIDVVLEALA